MRTTGCVLAGTMAVTDPAVLPYLPTTPALKPGGLPEVADSLRYAAGAIGAVLVLLLGLWAKKRRAPEAASH